MSALELEGGCRLKTGSRRTWVKALAAPRRVPLYSARYRNTLKMVLFAHAVWRFVVLLKKGIVAIAIAAALVFSLAAQDKKKEWKDRAEYDLYESITKTQDPNQWLA